MWLESKAGHAITRCSGGIIPQDSGATRGGSPKRRDQKPPLSDLGPTDRTHRYMSGWSLPPAGYSELIFYFFKVLFFFERHSDGKRQIFHALAHTLENL